MANGLAICSVIARVQRVTEVSLPVCLLCVSRLANYYSSRVTLTLLDTNHANVTYFQQADSQMMTVDLGLDGLATKNARRHTIAMCLDLLTMHMLKLT